MDLNYATQEPLHRWDVVLSENYDSTFTNVMFSLVLRLVNLLRYSRYHRLQKYCLSWWIRCQLDNRLGWVVLRSPSRMLVSVFPIKKCPGVRTGRSSGSVEIGLSGREFHIASISITKITKNVEMFENQELRDDDAVKMPFKRFHRGFP